MRLKAQTSPISLIFWLTLVASVYVFIYKMNWPGWSVGIAPVFFVSNYFMLGLTKYHFLGKTLVVKTPLNYTKIDLAAVRVVEIKNNPLWRQVIIGAPSQSLIVNYNKYDSIEILNSSQVIREQLLGSW